MTITVRGGLLLTAGFGLGYAKAMHDSDQITRALMEMKLTLDDLVKTVKYGDYIDGKAVEIEPPPQRKTKTQTQKETPKESQTT